MINYLYNNSTWNIEKKNTIWIYDYEYFYVYFNAQKKGKILKKTIKFPVLLFTILFNYLLIWWSKNML